MSASDPVTLAIDTSAAHCAAALVSGAAVAEQREAMERGQAERLPGLVDQTLGRAGRGYGDLTEIVVCVGPGNFTGLRIAISFAKGLGLALSLPVSGATRLGWIAAAAGLRHGALCAVVPGRRGRVFAQAFDAEGAALSDPGQMDAAEVSALARRHYAELVEGGADLPLTALIAAAHRQRLPATPVYLRGADAALPKDPPPPVLD